MYLSWILNSHSLSQNLRFQKQNMKQRQYSGRVLGFNSFCQLRSFRHILLGSQIAIVIIYIAQTLKMLYYDFLGQ
ncbi:unnamed protein product [Paramecium octaurelia]|uniref:Uncharacterized protein n=1 Tax=Paramecium octaurelia TaxID=43137 RepID=A0A8S1YLK3_PAROT|nr:unnamed protein product [Paramecium octaurelia]